MRFDSLHCIKTLGVDLRLVTIPCTRPRPYLICKSPDRIVYRRRQSRCLHNTIASTLPASAKDIFQLAGLPHSDLPLTVSRIFSFSSGSAACVVTPELITKFGAGVEMS